MATFAPSFPPPRPSYSQAREKLVEAIPPKLLCLLACGGQGCRYEGPHCWKSNQQVVRGLFSSWVTDDIIAMTRPSNLLIQKYDIIDQFQRLNVKSIINMQLPGEHAHCGPPLDPDSGFTYSPHIFMDNDIYFYNFGMPDFGVSSLGSFINAVKVLSFAVTEGRVAVHCHAGLGRTGVLIACYLIYTLRLSPGEAIHFVRIKRPRSIQTRAQINQVFAFARLLSAQLAQYPDVTLRNGAPFSLQLYLNRQTVLLHGREARRLRHTPKVVYLLCVRLVSLALGVTSPPELHQELQRRSTLWTLRRTVRQTLDVQRDPPLLGKEAYDGGSGLMTSWEEQLEFLDRKEEPIIVKRSYSDSHLNQLNHHNHFTGDKDLEVGPSWTSAPPTQCDVDGFPAVAALNGPVCSKHHRRRRKDSLHSSRLKESSTNTLHIYSTNVQVGRPTSLARAVAKAMGEQGTPGEPVEQRSALLQEEVNRGEGGWTLLLTESDPDVLCCLLWSWLEQLKEPVLSFEDIERMRVGVEGKKPLSVLKKAQRHTIGALLHCVCTISRLCPHREEAMLRRLVQSLTAVGWSDTSTLRPQQETGNYMFLIKVLKDSLRETFERRLPRTCSTNHLHQM